MGGDQAPRMVLKGADRALKRYPHVNFLLFGDEGKITPLIGKMHRLARRSTIQHTSELVTNDAKPRWRCAPVAARACALPSTRSPRARPNASSPPVIPER